MSHIGSTEPGTIPVTARRSVSDVLWVANTRHGPGGHWFARMTQDDGDHDHLGRPDDAVGYLVDHRVALPPGPPTPEDLADLAAIREMVRGLLDPAHGWTPEALAILARTRFRLDASGALATDPDGCVASAGDGPAHRAETGWATFVGDLLPPLLEVVRARDRLTMCGNPVCRLVFLDGSKSGTRRWCDDGGCGNRARVRRYRQRQAPVA